MTQINHSTWINRKIDFENGQQIQRLILGHIQLSIALFFKIEYETGN